MILNSSPDSKISIDSATSNEMPTGEAYLKWRETFVRFFDLKDDPDPEEAAAETLARVAEKIGENKQIDNLTAYSFGVARIVFIERCKKLRKERIAAEAFYAEKTARPSETENADFDLKRECFDKLPVADKKLMEEYFTEMRHADIVEYRQNLAAKFDISMNNLRLKIYRLRKNLIDCLRKKLGK